MRKSLFVKYFTLCSIAIFLSLLLLSSSILMFSTHYFENDQYQEMDQNIQKVSSIITKKDGSLGSDFFLFNADNSINEKAKALIDLMAGQFHARIYLSDSTGSILYASQNQYEISLETTTLPSDIMEQVNQEGKLYETGLLHNVYNDNAYTVGIPLSVDGEITGGMFIACSSQNLQTYQHRMIRIVVVSSLIVLIISFIILFIFTSKIVKPLKQMAAIAKQYGQGDFSQKLEVNGSDEIMQLAQAMNTMGNDLEVIDQSRRNFVSNVSHELKTPMTSISGFVDGILDGTIPESQQTHYLTIVSNEVKRLSHLVYVMLSLSKYESGNLQMHLVPCNITQILIQVVLSFEQAISKKEIAILGLEQDDVWVHADADLIHQVLYNLVENAVKFTNEKGTISFCYEKGTTKTELTIRNTGDGLSEEERNKIFERFYKTDASRGLDKTGVGLGLNIVKTIIRLHNGTISVNSEEGKYTEFTITLPASAGSENNE